MYTAGLPCYFLRVLEEVENGIAELSPDEQTKVDKDSEEAISDDGGEATHGRTHDREAATVTDVFEDARRLFPRQDTQKELAN